MPAETMSATREGSREDWLVVGTSTVCLAISTIHIYSMGVFLLSIERDLGWSRGEITSGLTIASVISVICAPFIGALIDRMGSRRIALPGMVIYCLAIVALGFASSSITSWWALWLLVSAGTILIKITVWMAAIAKRFNRRRGIAFAIALTGTGIGAAVLPALATALIGAFGWRQAYAILGLGGLALGLPLVLVFFRDTRPSAARVLRADMPGVDTREGLTSSVFIRLAVSTLVAMTTIIALSIHFVPMMIYAGLSSTMAAAIAGAIGVSSIMGRICCGMLLDRFHGPFVGAFGLGLPLIVCILLLGFDGSPVWGLVVAVLIGISLGAETDVVAFLASKYFGLRNYGTLFGTLAGLLALGGGMGPLLAGAIYDRFGNYEPLLWVLIPAAALSAILTATLGRYPDFSQRKIAKPA